MPRCNANKRFGTNTKANQKDDVYLLSTAVFVKRGKGVSFSDEFIGETALTFPNISIEDKLEEKGINPDFFRKKSRMVMRLFNIMYYVIYSKLRAHGGRRVL